ATELSSQRVRSVATGQSASWSALAVVEPRSIRLKAPAWVGMMNEIEPCSGDLSDLGCRISGYQDSWVFRDRKLSMQGGIEPVAADRLMFFRDLRRPPHQVKFEAVIAGGVKDM